MCEEITFFLESLCLCGTHVERLHQTSSPYVSTTRRLKQISNRGKEEMGKEGAEPVEVRNSIFYSRLTLDGANSIPVLMQRLTMYLLEVVVPSA